LTDFTGFRVLNPILHVLCFLTRKIVDFTSENSFLTTMMPTIRIEETKEPYMILRGIRHMMEMITLCDVH